MKRIDKLTNIYLEAYLKEAGDSKHVYALERGYPHIYFRTSELDLRKRSLNVPKSYIKKDGTVNVKRIRALLKKDIRKDVVNSLGYRKAWTKWGEQYPSKREGLCYSDHSTKRHLRGL